MKWWNPQHNGEGEVEWFVRQVTQLYGRQLQGLVLYGSAAAGEFLPEASDLNLLVVLDRVGWSELVRLNPVLAEWRERFRREQAPWLVPAAELAEAARVFPMQFRDMKERRKILAGDDVIAGLAVPGPEEIETRSALAWQVRYELHVLRGDFRSGYAAHADDPERVKELLLRWYSQILTWGRHLLVLKGQTPPLTKSETLAPLAALAGLRVEPFQELARLREDRWAAPSKGWAALMEAMLDQLDRLDAALSGSRAPA